MGLHTGKPLRAARRHECEPRCASVSLAQPDRSTRLPTCPSARRRARSSGIYHMCCAVLLQTALSLLTYPRKANQEQRRLAAPEITVYAQIPRGGTGGVRDCGLCQSRYGLHKAANVMSCRKGHYYYYTESMTSSESSRTECLCHPRSEERKGLQLGRG